MNEEIKQKWLDALRSGEYKQARNKLCDLETDTYCCLGVLCEIYTQDHPEESCREVIEGEVFYFKNDQVLPNRIIEWADFEEPNANPCIMINDHNISVAELNDNGKSFTEIADFIEYEL